MSMPKPALKDINISLLNKPGHLLIGTQNYEFKFVVMNLNDDEKDLIIEFISNSFNLDKNKFELQLASKERKEIIINATPSQDGVLILQAKVLQKKIIKYVEKVLEGEEISASEGAEIQEKVAVAKPAKMPTTKPIKKPPKPTKMIKPVIPIKKEREVPDKQVDGIKKLENKIAEIRQSYMDNRNKLQSIEKGSPEYRKIYNTALKEKEEYDRLKQIFEDGGTFADAYGEEKDPIAELKELMSTYNELKQKLSTLDASSQEYNEIKQTALEIYNQYNEKRKKAKRDGLIS